MMQAGRQCVTAVNSFLFQVKVAGHFLPLSSPNPRSFVSGSSLIQYHAELISLSLLVTTACRTIDANTAVCQKNINTFKTLLLAPQVEWASIYDDAVDHVIVYAVTPDYSGNSYQSSKAVPSGLVKSAEVTAAVLFFSSNFL